MARISRQQHKNSDIKGDQIESKRCEHTQEMDYTLPLEDEGNGDPCFSYRKSYVILNKFQVKEIVIQNKTVEIF